MMYTLPRYRYLSLILSTLLNILQNTKIIKDKVQKTKGLFNYIILERIGGN